jgi:putative membrane protein
MMWGCPGCGFGYGGGGWFFGLLWFLLIAWLVWTLVRAMGGGGSPGESRAASDRALEILRERYARGEIDRETFERMKRDLGG